jgi:hypothetical protein
MQLKLDFKGEGKSSCKSMGVQAGFSFGGKGSDISQGATRVKSDPIDKFTKLKKLSPNR